MVQPRDDEHSRVLGPSRLEVDFLARRLQRSVLDAHFACLNSLAEVMDHLFDRRSLGRRGSG